MSKVDFLLCNKESLESLVSVACNMYNQGLSVLKIADNLDVRNTAVLRYLKQGNQLGLCNYTTPIEEKEKNKFAIVELCNKSVYTPKELSELLSLPLNTIHAYLRELNNENLIPYDTDFDRYVICEENGLVFKNPTGCEQLSEEYFGQKFNTDSVARVCRKERKTAYGYKFRYITKEEYVKYFMVHEYKLCS